VLAYANDATTAERVTKSFAEAIEARRAAFVEASLSPDAAVAEARRRLNAHLSLPVLLCDIADNPGAGAASDNTAILRALVAQDADRAVAAIVCDAQAARAAHAVGVGASIELALGGRADQPACALRDGVHGRTGDGWELYRNGSDVARLNR
jgi:microcystin degradation protein MlrC